MRTHAAHHAIIILAALLQLVLVLGICYLIYKL